MRTQWRRGAAAGSVAGCCRGPAGWCLSAAGALWAALRHGCAGPWRGGGCGVLSAPRGRGCCLLGLASLCRRRWPAAPQPSAWLPGGCWRRLGGCSERPVSPCQTGRMAMPDGPFRAARRPLFVGAAGPAVVCPRMCGPGAGRAWACLGFAAEVGWGARWAKKASCRLRSRQEDGLWSWRGRWLLPAPQCGPRPVTATRAPRRSRRCGGRSRRALPARRRRGSRSPWASCRSSAV